MTTELNTNITTFMQPISVKWKACSIFNHTCRTCKLQFVAEIKFYIRIHTWHNYCIFKIKNSQSGEILKTLIPFYITVKQISIDLLSVICLEPELLNEKDDFFYLLDLFGSYSFYIFGFLRLDLSGPILV